MYDVVSFCWLFSSITDLIILSRLAYSEVTAPSLLFFFKSKKSFGKCLLALLPIALGTRTIFLFFKILSFDVVFGMLNDRF